MERKTFTWKELEKMDQENFKVSGGRVTLETLLIKSGIQKSGNVIDYSLPHTWVKFMSEKYDIPYADIVQTSVMVYNEKSLLYGQPMSYCTEIQKVFDKEVKEYVND